MTTPAARSARVSTIRPAAPLAPVYLSPEQVCQKVPGWTPEQLKQMRSAGKGPAYIKPNGPRGHVTLYVEADVDKYLAAQRTATREQR